MAAGIHATGIKYTAHLSYDKVKAIVTAIKLTHLNTTNINWSVQTNAPVIGIFKRYVTNIRTYTFQNNLGKINYIKVTPYHAFYVRNQHKFIAIKDISDHDQLSGMSHAKPVLIHLIYANGQHNHCGIRHSNRRSPSLVYNRRFN